MKHTHEITRTQLLADAKYLVTKAVKAGLMKYPAGTDIDTNGTPLIDPDDSDERERITKHTPEMCRKAFMLRERGLTLEQVAKACHVATGSVHYIISQGHEIVLKEERLSQGKAMSQDAAINNK